MPHYVDPTSIDFSLLDAKVYDPARITLGLSQSYKGIKCSHGDTPQTGIKTLVGEREETKDYLTKVVNALNSSMSAHRTLSIEYSALVHATVVKTDQHSEFCLAYMQEQEKQGATIENHKNQFEAIQLQMGKIQLENDRLRTKYTEAYNSVLAWETRGDRFNNRPKTPQRSSRSYRNGMTLTLTL